MALARGANTAAFSTHANPSSRSVSGRQDVKTAAIADRAVGVQWRVRGWRPAQETLPRGSTHCTGCPVTLAIRS